MKDTTARQLRAYVGIDGVRIEFKADRTEIRIRVRNSGQTPAYAVRHWAEIDRDTYPRRKKTPVPDPEDLVEKNSLVLPPDGTFEKLRVDSKKLRDESAFGTANDTMYVFGEIVYKDAFRIERRTKYRVMYGGPFGSVRRTTEKGVDIGSFVATDDGNEAD
jgi:hypothetical protein